MKVDFKKTLSSYRATAGRFDVIDIPSFQYLMVDGYGDPNTASYADAIASIYPIAYALKFASKRELDRDYVVMPLEALWWATDMNLFTDRRDKTRWSWTLMIMVPEWIDEQMFRVSVDTVVAKRGSSGLDAVRLENLTEGRSVQTLHIGPYDDESAVLEQMHHHFIPGEGLEMTGKHHEIYLSDARRVEPAKLRTILRQPVLPAK